jgi:hypothetical protein
MMGEKLDPDVKLDAPLRALEFAPSLNFSQFLERLCGFMRRPRG